MAILFGSMGKRIGNCVLPQDQNKICAPSFHSSISNRYQESGYKLLTRWNYTPTRLQRMFPASSGVCWRCGQAPGDFLHFLVMLCPVIILGTRCTLLHSDHTIQNVDSFFPLHHNQLSYKIYKNLVIIHLTNAAPFVHSSCMETYLSPVGDTVAPMGG